MAKRWLTQKTLKIKRRKAKQRGIMPKLHQASVNSGPVPDDKGWYSTTKTLNYDLDVILVKHYNTPRQEAQALRHKIKSACPEYMYFRLVDDSWLRARLYFSSDHRTNIIVEYNPKTKVHRRSIPYKNRDVARIRWEQSTIDWAEDFLHPNISETFPPS